jgi:hypothetical protein
MTLQKQLFGATATVASIIALVLAAGATAVAMPAGTRSFTQTFPVASKLCANVKAGTVKSKKLKAQSTAVIADCTALETNFGAAQLAVNTARTTDNAQIAADKAAINTACPPSMIGKPACTSVRASEKAAIKALVANRSAAVHLYYKTVESMRRAFWHQIHLLRGLSHIRADKPLPILNV